MDIKFPRNLYIVKPNSLEELTVNERLFDNVYYGATTNKYGTSHKAVNYDSVGFFKDKLGNYDLNYVSPSITNPAVTGKPPYLIDGLAVVFDNQPQTAYYSSLFTAVNPPYEVWFTRRQMPGQPYEAHSIGFRNGAYVGDSNSVTRIINPATGLLTGATNSAPQYYLNIVERLKLFPTYAEYYRNNVLLGTYVYQTVDTTAPSNIQKVMNSIAVDTNSQDSDFMAMHVKYSHLTNAQALAVYTDLSAKFNIGSTPNQILLHNMKWTKTNGVYTPSFDIEDKKGIGYLPINQWPIQWHWRKLETNFFTQPVFSNHFTVTASDFPADYQSSTGFLIKYRITPVASDGTTWRPISGTYGLYSLDSQVQNS